MADALSDLVTFSGALNNMAGSLSRLQEVRIDLEAKRVNSEVSKMNYDFLSRMNLKQGDPNRIDTNNWRDELQKHNDTVNSMIGSITDQGIRDNVFARTQEANQGFAEKMMLTMAGKEVEKAQNDFISIAQNMAATGDFDGLASHLQDGEDREILNPEQLDKVRRDYFNPMMAKKIVDESLIEYDSDEAYGKILTSPNMREDLRASALEYLKNRQTVAANYMNTAIENEFRGKENSFTVNENNVLNIIDASKDAGNRATSAAFDKLQSYQIDKSRHDSFNMWISNWSESNIIKKGNVAFVKDTNDMLNDMKNTIWGSTAKGGAQIDEWLRALNAYAANPKEKSDLGIENVRRIIIASRQSEVGKVNARSELSRIATGYYGVAYGPSATTLAFTALQELGEAKGTEKLTSDILTDSFVMNVMASLDSASGLNSKGIALSSKIAKSIKDGKKTPEYLTGDDMAKSVMSRINDESSRREMSIEEKRALARKYSIDILNNANVWGKRVQLGVADKITTSNVIDFYKRSVDNKTGDDSILYYDSKSGAVQIPVGVADAYKFMRDVGAKMIMEDTGIKDRTKIRINDTTDVSYDVDKFDDKTKSMKTYRYNVDIVPGVNGKDTISLSRMIKVVDGKRVSYVTDYTYSYEPEDVKKARLGREAADKVKADTAKALQDATEEMTTDTGAVWGNPRLRVQGNNMRKAGNNMRKAGK